MIKPKRRALWSTLWRAPATINEKDDEHSLESQKVCLQKKTPTDLCAQESPNIVDSPKKNLRNFNLLRKLNKTIKNRFSPNDSKKMKPLLVSDDEESIVKEEQTAPKKLDRIRQVRIITRPRRPKFSKRSSRNDTSPGDSHEPDKEHFEHQYLDLDAITIKNTGSIHSDSPESTMSSRKTNSRNLFLDTMCLGGTSNSYPISPSPIEALDVPAAVINERSITGIDQVQSFCDTASRIMRSFGVQEDEIDCSGHCIKPLCHAPDTRFAQITLGNSDHINSLISVKKVESTCSTGASSSLFSLPSTIQEDSPTESSGSVDAHVSSAETETLRSAIVTPIEAPVIFCRSESDPSGQDGTNGSPLYAQLDVPSMLEQKKNQLIEISFLKVTETSPFHVIEQVDTTVDEISISRPPRSIHDVSHLSLSSHHQISSLSVLTKEYINQDEDEEIVFMDQGTEVVYGDSDIVSQLSSQNPFTDHDFHRRRSEKSGCYVVVPDDFYSVQESKPTLLFTSAWNYHCSVVSEDEDGTATCSGDDETNSLLNSFDEEAFIGRCQPKKHEEHHLCNSGCQSFDSQFSFQRRRREPKIPMTKFDSSPKQIGSQKRTIFGDLEFIELSDRNVKRRARSKRGSIHIDSEHEVSNTETRRKYSTPQTSKFPRTQAVGSYKLKTLIDPRQGRSSMSEKVVSSESNISSRQGSIYDSRNKDVDGEVSNQIKENKSSRTLNSSCSTHQSIGSYNFKTLIDAKRGRSSKSAKVGAKHLGSYELHETTSLKPMHFHQSNRDCQQWIR